MSVRNLSKSYNGGRIHAVGDLTLAVDGEFAVLLGPSGCGKTTTLRLIAGLESPDTGTIEIGGRIVNAIPPKDRDIAMVFQDFALYPHMTVRDNLAFGMKVRRTPKAQIETRIQDVARMLRILPILDRKPAFISGGERQRVALGRAITREPAAYLFDEPLSNLDPTLRLHLRSQLRHLAPALGATALYVTHDQEEAMTLADRLFVMQAGRILQSGTPQQVYDRPNNRLVASFLGRHPMSFVDGTIQRDASGTVFTCPLGRMLIPGEWGGPRGHPATPATLGIRPEHVRTDEHGNAAASDQSETAGKPGHYAVDLKVELVDFVGDSNLIHLVSCSGQRLAARLTAETTIQAGQTVRCHLDLNRAHLFDAGPEGQRILARSIHGTTRGTGS